MLKSRLRWYNKNRQLNHFLTEESRYRGTYYDYMTGLPNRAYFYELAEAGCKRMQEQNIDSAILYFDLTGLKRFNRRHNFAEGDRLISAVAAILAKNFSSESCARFAQDHFAVVAQGRDYEQRDELMAELYSHNEETMKNGGIVIACGMSEYEDDKCVAEVYDRADHNMYDNKISLKAGR